MASLLRYFVFTLVLMLASCGQSAAPGGGVGAPGGNNGGGGGGQLDTIILPGGESTDVGGPINNTETPPIDRIIYEDAQHNLFPNYEERFDVYWDWVVENNRTITEFKLEHCEDLDDLKDFVFEVSGKNLTCVTP